MDEAPKARESLRFPFTQRFSRVRVDVADSVAKVVEEGKKFSSLLRHRRGSYQVADDASFSSPPKPNPDFARLIGKALPSKVSLSIPQEHFTSMEAPVSSLPETQSFNMWLLGGLLRYIKDTGFVPLDVPLFEKLGLKTFSSLFYELF